MRFERSGLSSSTARIGAIAASGAVMTLLALGFLAPASHGQVRPEPSAERGLALAQRLCTNCHVIEGNSQATVPAGVPTFRGIANRQGQTGERIRDIIMRPHTPMPSISLSNEEIVDIVLYLETLRTDPAIPPLIDKGSTKPLYPKAG